MTASDEWWQATRHLKNKLRTELDWEEKTLNFREIVSLGSAVTVYVCQQFEGDLLIVPRRSCYQVLNHGGLTIRTSWSRMSLASLEEAIQWECTMYRRCTSMDIISALFTR